MNIKLYSGPVTSADQMNTEERGSFNNGYRTVVLPGGFELWRFVSQQSKSRFGAFWIDTISMQHIMQALHANNNFSQQYKKENVRNSLAILNNWSYLNWRLKIKLRKDVIAYVGETGTQKQFADIPNDLPFGGARTIQKATETRIGRHTQYVIPRFKGLSSNNEWASIEMFVHI